MYGAVFRSADVFPWCVRPVEGISNYTKGKEHRRCCDDQDELNLRDLEAVSPTFISNITVNDWQVEIGAEHSHHLMSFSSEGVKLVGIDDQTTVSTDLTDRFHSQHMRLSAAMAISGAALSFDMGGHQGRLDTVLDLLALLGIQMGDVMVCDQCLEAKTSWKKKVLDRYKTIYCGDDCFFQG